MNVLIVNDLSWDNFGIVSRRVNPKCINPDHRINYFYGKHLQYIANICNKNSMTLIRRPLILENLPELFKDALLYTKFCIVFHNFIEYNTLSDFIIKTCSDNNIPYFIFSEHCEHFYFNGEYINDIKFKNKVRAIEKHNIDVNITIPKNIRISCEKTCPSNILEVINHIRTKYQILKSSRENNKIVLLDDFMKERKKLTKTNKEMSYIDYMNRKNKWFKETVQKR